MDSNPKSLLDKLVGLCLSMLIGAAAIFIAVKLIEAIWTALLVIVGVGVFVAIAWAILRGRSNSGW